MNLKLLAIMTIVITITFLTLVPAKVNIHEIAQTTETSIDKSSNGSGIYVKNGKVSINPLNELNPLTDLNPFAFEL